MGIVKQFRGWQRVGLCSLLCLTVPGPAFAQTSTVPVPVPAPAGPAQTSTASSASTSTSTKPAAKTIKHRTTRHGSGKRTSSHATSSHGKKNAKKRGQKAIDSDRAREIQTALIREHYLQGQPTGAWDATTQAAMRRYQADHGWQSKTTPDSRALIKLGLGPSHDHLLNPESAMTTPMPSAPAANPKAASKQTPADNNLPQQ